MLNHDYHSLFCLYMKVYIRYP